MEQVFLGLLTIIKYYLTGLFICAFGYLLGLLVSSENKKNEIGKNLLILLIGAIAYLVES